MNKLYVMLDQQKVAYSHESLLPMILSFHSGVVLFWA